VVISNLFYQLLVHRL